ncbi:MAG: tRNA (adenosine(37)-N6)-threonylcarbamoyltransferase complex ATPase subunit type 1 TsaE [Clostridia bacterium]|nr:tRNA (adenosine(37)-N6)-threonylcarbamoyltransferase complex ATPase subunit type 1 TsaE [Clostridia bacterium]
MNLRTTKMVAHQVAHRLQQNNGGVVLLCGAMGAGKTTLVGEIVQILCPTAQPCSPTYTIINQYAENIFHADLYRLWESEGVATVPDQVAINQIMESIGLLDLCIAGNYVLIEWPNGIDFPQAIHITINIKEDGNREFIVD